MTNSSDFNVERLAGKFIVFDGPDGCGKSTQRQMLGDFLTSQGAEVVHCKDPGGTAIGDRIRHVLLDYDLSEMDVRCETFLFMASRAQLVGEIIEPALRDGKIVLCDRFISSTCAYQGAAGYDIQRVIDLGYFAIGQTWPELTVILDVPVKEGFARTNRKPVSRRSRKNHVEGQTMMFHDAHTDAMESRPDAFHQKVRQILIHLPDNYPGQVKVLDGLGTAAEVHERVWEAVAGAFR